MIDGELQQDTGTNIKEFRVMVSLGLNHSKWDGKPWKTKLRRGPQCRIRNERNKREREHTNRTSLIVFVSSALSK